MLILVPFALVLHNYARHFSHIRTCHTNIGPIQSHIVQRVVQGYRYQLVMRDLLISVSVKREFRKLLFLTRDLKVLREP